jgi:hypothetical protein
VRSLARLLVLAPLTLIAVWGAGPVQQAEAGDHLSGSLTERQHAIAVVPGIESTTLEVTRTFFNPTFEHEQLGLQIDLPCEAVLDGLELRGPDDARGRPTWVPGKLIDPEVAGDRYFDFRFEGDGQALDGDTMAVLSRGDSCRGWLELFPVPPMRERSIRYRVQLPAHYGAGAYRVELPAFELELEGAQLSVAAPPAGFALQIDGQAVTGTLELSGRTPHTLTLTPDDDDHTRVALASIDLEALGATRDAQSVIAAELDLPLRLVDLPPVRRVVVAIDASHSLDDDSRMNLQRLAVAYLGQLTAVRPEARVEVMTFDRSVRRIHGEFVDPGLAGARLQSARIESRNGSEPGLALAHARELLGAARQPGEAGVDWVLLFSDLELRDEYSLAAELDGAEASDVRLHVIRPAPGRRSLTPMPTEDPWMAIAQAAGGAHFAYAIDDSMLARDGAELIDPNRVWDLRLIHEDTRGRTSVIALADELGAGEPAVWIERLSANGVERVSFEAFSWASPLTWSAESSRRADERWAGRLTAGDRSAIDLGDVESKALAELAGTVTPWTSMIAEARFEGRSTPSGMWGHGGGWHGSSTGCGLSSGIRRRLHVTGELDLSVLRGAIEQAIGECPDLATGSLAFEILDTEIVNVESAHACAREAIWQLDLREWPSFRHPIVQIAFDESGVQRLQLTSLADETPASEQD